MMKFMAARPNGPPGGFCLLGKKNNDYTNSWALLLVMNAKRNKAKTTFLHFKPEKKVEKEKKKNSLFIPQIELLTHSSPGAKRVL